MGVGDEGYFERWVFFYSGWRRRAGEETEMRWLGFGCVWLDLMR